MHNTQSIKGGSGSLFNMIPQHPESSPPLQRFPPAARGTELEHPSWLSESQVAQQGLLHEQQQQQVQVPQVPPHVERWRNTVALFQRALRSPPNEEFHAWNWVSQLGMGLADYFYHASRMHYIVHRFQLHNKWRPLIPAIAIMFILLSLTSYFLSLRIHLVRQRWCPATAATTTTTTTSSSTVNATTANGSTGEACAWEYLHTTIVSYLGIMILYTYIRVIFDSPGVVLPPRLQSLDAPTEYRWQAIHSQGGFLGWDATLDVAAERRRVEAYGPAPVENVQGACDGNAMDINYVAEYPPTAFTFCKKCNVWRPPRCHHCSTCRRCVLQMDHHCPWVNNCIGYNNVRTFILSLTFLAMGCWYGAFLLAMPFFELIQHQVMEHGWKLLYGNKTGFLDLPGLPTLLYRLLLGNLQAEVWIKVIFPLLAGVGSVLTVFLAFHINYLLSAHTTLENTIVLTNMRTRAMDALLLPMGRRRSSLSRSGETPMVLRPTNPFDQGWKQNLLQILGPNLLCLLLPIGRYPPPPTPYMPPPKSKCM